MRKRIGPVALLVALVACDQARASQPCGVYARIDKVEVGPTGDKPTWVKIHGDFIVVELGNHLREPVRGFMFCSVVSGREDLCRLEWADLRKIAGTDKNYVAFGSAFSEVDHSLLRAIHKTERAENKPAPYPLNHGLTRLRTERPDDRADNPNPVVRLQTYLKANPLPKR
jgi:hypothetical protein